ncbi:MAG TPA: ABC transporter ATP-binding protein [Mycobacteriales bacterium]|nr:ABC transporter ATP-binding protein [Mycobacteriales bacterium]
MRVADVRPVVHLHDAALRFGERTVWSGLDFDVAPGEFIAVLGPNGSGKTSLLKVLLGLQRLTSGVVEVLGSAPSRGNKMVGYVPQQKGFDRDLPLRGRDLVALGLDGHRWGIPLPSRARRGRVDAALADVGAQRYAKAAVGRLSGGEQQRLRMAQALLGDPGLLLCDEPLLSLDLHHQRVITELVDRRRREHGTAVLFVTHEVNPVLPLVDRVLYLAAGRWASGAPEEVLTSERLSALYGTTVEVVRVGGRFIVAGAPDAVHAEPGGSHHHPDDSASAILR